MKSDLFYLVPEKAVTTVLIFCEDFRWYGVQKPNLWLPYRKRTVEG